MPEQRNIPIYNPPGATETEPVGLVETYQSLGGWVVRGSLNGGFEHCEMVPYGKVFIDAMFLNRRVNGATNRVRDITQNEVIPNIKTSDALGALTA